MRLVLFCLSLLLVACAQQPPRDDGLYRALGEASRADDRPRYCDACFTGDYPTALTDQDDVVVTNQLELLAERVA